MANQTNEASDHFIYILCKKKKKKTFLYLKKNQITLTVQSN